jgi:hypothetical protein
MYDKQIQIPAVGERVAEPDVRGKALQVTRLDFIGSEDPKGNPIVEADAGRLSARMNVGDPIETEFQGLTIKNENAEAAGTSAIIRVYQKGDKVSRVPRKRQMVARAKIDESLTVESRGSGSLVDPDAGESITLMNEKSEYVRFLTLELRAHPEGSISSGFPVDLTLRFSATGVITERVHVSAPEEQGSVWLQDLLVPPNTPVSLRGVAHGSTGDGKWRVGYSLTRILDKAAPIPPR